MPTPNIQIQLSGNLTLQNILGGGVQQVVNQNFGNPTLQGTWGDYSAYFQAATSPGSVYNLTGQVVFIVFVQNLHATASLQVSYENEGSSTVMTTTIGPGGIFLYFTPGENAGTGIQALTLIGLGSVVPAYVLVGY
jgi:hypothetical protein